MMVVLGKISIVDRVIIAYTRDDLSEFKTHFDHPECQVCHRKHERTELYIVEEDGVRYTAGKGCLERKFGKIVVRRAIDAAHAEEKNIGMNCFKTKASIIAALRQYHTDGYIKSVSSGDFKAKYGVYYSQAMYNSNSSEYEKLADNVIEHFVKIEPTNSFIESLHTLATNNYHSEKVLGLFPAMINIYYNNVNRSKLIESSKNTIVYGEEGDKVKNVNLQCEVIEVRKVSTYDYDTFLQTYCKDDNGHVFVWNNTFTDKSGYLCEKGSIINLINFTVKKHFTGAYGNVTAIVRPKYEVIKQLTKFVSHNKES